MQLISQFVQQFYTFFFGFVILQSSIQQTHLSPHLPSYLSLLFCGNVM